MKKITQLFLGGVMLLSSFLSMAQVTALNKIPNDVPVLHFQQPDLKPIFQEDVERDRNGEFFRIGIIGSEVNITPQNSGIWTTKSNGDRVWRLKIKYPGAQGMSFMFSKFHLYGNATVNVFDMNGIRVHDTYTAADVQDHGQQNLSLCEGNLLMLELVEPKGTNPSVIEMDNIIYLYRGLKSESQEKNFGASESCQVNVNCTPVGTNWQSQKRGVARILVSTSSGQGWCTGSLVNNVRQDCTPYFLTAYHCGGNATTSQFNQWRFYFRFEAPGCTNPSSSSGVVSSAYFTGCVKISDSNDGGENSSDMLLLHLGSLANASSTITTLKNTHNVYWNGWDANTSATTGGVGIHHPAGDIKKISTFSGTTVTAGFNSSNPTHWRVIWTSNSNGHGVTEGGSSGSPLFNNSNGRIIGTLTGGSSYCSALSSPDLYGKMSYHWTSNGTANNRRLKPYLDPDNTGVLVLNGSADPCASSSGSAPNANFVANQTNVPTGTTVSFTDQTTGSPTSWSWSITPASGWAYAGGTNASSQNPQVTFNTAGSYTVALTATNSNGSDTETKNNYIVVTTSGGGGTPCAATSSTCDEYIAQVQLNTINNSTACTNYTDYSSISTTLSAGSSYTAIVTPGIVGSGPNYGYSDGDVIGVWIDYNNNGSFTDANETIGTIVFSAAYTGQFNFTVPAGVTPGTVRMRVRIDYLQSGTISPCGTTQYGEVEDYRIVLVGGGVGLEDLESLNTVSLYPNPTSDEITIDLNTTALNAEISVLDITGKEVLKSSNKNVESVKLNLSEVATGVYQVVIQTELGKVVKRVTKH